MASEGWRVFGTSRTDRPPEPGITMLPLDVCSDPSVSDCVARVLEAAGAIDVLVNNAGYVHEGPLEAIGLEDLRAIFDTNFFGAARMVQAVLPGMRARRRGRIINVGSTAGLMPLPFYGAYCASKHALESYSESLRHELRPLGIDVSIVEPGFFRTHSAVHKRQAASVIPDYEPHCGRMLAALAREETQAPPPDPVVDALVRLATSTGRNRLRHVVGPHAVNYWLRGLLPEWIWDAGLRRHWRLD